MTKKAADPKQESLAKELKGLIPKLDSEGLAFLIEQARIHLYNMQVDKLNKAGAELSTGTSRGRKTPETKSGELRIGGSESGSSYYLYYGNNEVMFSRDEMTQLVKIASGQGINLEIRERLFNWLEAERLDVFSVLPAADKFDPRLKDLVTLLKTKFKIRGN